MATDHVAEKTDRWDVDVNVPPEAVAKYSVDLN